LAEVVRTDLGIDCAAEPGTGAAGGLGYGARVFLNGRFESGFDIFARIARLSEKIDSAELVITGEGAIDRQTAMGKGTGAVARLAREHNKRCIGLAGILPDGSRAADFFHALFSIVPELADADEAKRNAASLLELLSAKAASSI
jgi:glycerate kinase